jgi:hypothetical protein
MNIPQEVIKCKHKFIEDKDYGEIPIGAYSPSRDAYGGIEGRIFYCNKCGEKQIRHIGEVWIHSWVNQSEEDDWQYRH